MHEEYEKSNTYIYKLFLLVGCTKNLKPSDEQILADLNQLGYTSTIMYAYTGNDVGAVSDIKETHNLELASFQVEKSNTEGKEYEAWLEVTAKDAEVTETANAYVKYTGYDNVDQRNTITGTVGFETTVDFYFDPDSKSWYCNDLRSESATITPVDLQILEKFIVNESQSVVAEKNTEELDDRRYFSQKIMNPEIGESLVKNSNGNFEQLDCHYSLGVNTIYYTSEVEGIAHIQFATGSGAPAFTYELSNELFEEEARDNWKVSCTYPVYYNASGNGKYAGTITIEYPLKSDMNKALVAVRVDAGTEKEITLQGTSMAEVSDKDLEVRIREYVKITHDADTEGKHVWAETRRVQEIEQEAFTLIAKMCILKLEWEEATSRAHC